MNKVLTPQTEMNMLDVTMPSEKIETICRQCPFAKFEHPVESKEQTGCYAGRIDKYKEQGVVLKEYEDKDGWGFYGIPDRVCAFYRNKEWFDKQPKDESLVAIARDEITLRMEAVIYISANATFQDIGITLDSLANGKIKPTQIILCDHQNIRPSTFRKWIQGRCLKVSWRAEHIRENADFYRCVDICMKKASGRYVAVFCAGFKVPEDFISRLDISLNDEMERFLYLEPCDTNNNGMVIQNIVSKQYQGNRENPLVDKIRRKALEQECPHMVRIVTEIVPSLTQSNCQQSQSSSLATTTKGL